MKRTLVVYFSRAQENYMNGDIVNLKVGNTFCAAKMIRDICDADLFEIKPKKEYPFEYRACTEIAKKELNNQDRPELMNDIDISLYDTIFIGYPNWWGTMPMAVWTFLESHDFTNKVILPFCTHEGSQMGRSVKDLSKLVKNATIKNGLSIQGSFVNNAKSNIEQWLKQELY